MRTVCCLAVTIFLLLGAAHAGRAQTNPPSYKWTETNDGKFPMWFTNVLSTNTFKPLTGAPPFYSTNVWVTNVYIPITTNYGPLPTPPPKKPWYRRWWDWFKGLF